MAVGQAIVVITRNVDLSVGSVLGLSVGANATVLLGDPFTFNAGNIDQFNF